MALVIGLFLVMLGLLQTAPAVGPDTLNGTPRRSSVLDRPEEHIGLAAPRATTTGPAQEPDVETYLEARLNFASDGAPAALARVGLWRAQSGEGPSFRPPRRLTELTTSGDGHVRFIAPPGVPLELFGRSADDGPTARLEVGSLSAGETRSVRLTLERPPAPLVLHVLDAASRGPITGAAIRSVAIDQDQLGLEDFPGTTRLVQRTDGDGEVELPGNTRDAHWLLIDAAGYSPAALDPASLEGRATAEIALLAAGRLTVQVVDASDAAQGDIEITLQANLNGYQTTFTAITNQRGEATFRRLPVMAPLIPSAGEVNAVPALFDAVTLAPGEKRSLRLELAPQ